MYQIEDITKIHPFIVCDINGNEVTTLTSPVCTYRINGGAKSTLETTISAYDTTMKSFLITIPGSIAVNKYDSIELCIAATEGTAHILIDVVPNLDILIWKLRHKSKFI